MHNELTSQTEAVANSTPVREFILKVASRCNLNCTYCYEYHLGDESWKSAGKFMPAEVYSVAARKIVNHARRHDLGEVGIALHGGEPLLLGARRLDEMVTALRQEFEVGGVGLQLGMQTNGLLLTEGVSEIIGKHNIRVGISVDGGPKANDLNRVDHRGNGSYDRIAKGIETLKRTVPHEPCGLLAVIDVRNDPLDVFDSLAAFGIDNIDLLLPHHNWDRPPPHKELLGEDAYGQWLSAIWREWIRGRHSHLRIRFLDNIVARLVGHPGLYEQMTDSPVSLMTINTDGDFEGVDTLKSTGSGIQKTGLNILRNDIDDVLLHPLYQFRQDWQRSLPRKCFDCDIKRICTGGYIPHRYSATTGFNNPSVFCKDIQHIVSQIDDSIRIAQRV